MRHESARLRVALVMAACLLAVAAPGSGAPKAAPIPDLTQGGTKDDKHDWNLGPTGARGWIWGRLLESTGATQILITQVDPGSPADGVLQKDDVILGAGGRRFAHDARKEFGRAITEAETPEQGGALELLRWRGGEVQTVVVRLPVLGRYTETAPYDCEKTRRIIDAGCEHIARHLKGGIDGKVNALALLASGRPQYLPLVRDYVHKLAPPDLELKIFGPEAGGMASWHWGYTNLLLTEYYLATGDAYVLPAIKEHAVKIAMGQSVVGSWGHGMAWPADNDGNLHGRLGGYGALNQAGLVCHLSLVLAEKCGVEHPEVRRAIEKANAFFSFYVDKGVIPYGDHSPGDMVHDDNGKNSIAAVCFDVQRHRDVARYFARMTVASYGERERGHTGNYWSYLWGALSANRAGPQAQAAFLSELRWYYDMARKWDGSFPYQGGAGMGGGEHKYGNWDCTGAFILGLTTPLKKLHITGKNLDPSIALTGDQLAATIEAGRGFSSWHKGVEPFQQKPPSELLTHLGSWSPAVRDRAARALAATQADVVPQLIRMLNGDDRHARYGACNALGAMKADAAPAVPALTTTLEADDLWLRVQAVYALSHIGAPARSAVPTLLRAAAQVDEEDPRQMLQRYLAFGLFYPGGAMGQHGILARSLSDVDRQQLYEAVKVLLKNPDGRARGAVGSVYRHLTFDELKPILPAILHAVREPAPSGVMFASGIRMSGLKLLAEHRIEEGMPLCLETMDIEGWGKRHRIDTCLKILQQYGGAAKPMIPRLRELQQQLKTHREARGLKPQIQLVQQTIDKIEQDSHPPALRSIGDI